MSATLNLPFFHVVSLLGFFEMIIQCIRKKVYGENENGME